MSTPARKPRLALDDVANWLRDHEGSPPEDLTPLEGGFWSAAWAYRAHGEERVLRVGDMKEGFEIDAQATRLVGDRLPVPAVLEIGDAFGRHFAISRRHDGRFIEAVSAQESDDVGVAMAGLLAGLRAVPAAPDAPVTWTEPETDPPTTWHDWLRAGLVDEGGSRGGWRAELAADPRLDDVFRRCEARIEALLPLCPERRDLVHGDLLHQNVLVDEADASRVTAVFSWKCSVRGDFLFDVAWCTFWGAGWHPGIAGADLLRRTLEADDLSPADLEDAAARHECYALRIGASHMGWYVWTGQREELEKLAGQLERVLAANGS